MADPSLVFVNTAADNFQNWIDKFNNTVADIQTIVLTANSTAGITTGNAYLVGNLSALRILTPTLAGGNLSGTANLTVSTNVSVGNSTVNTWIGFAQINIGTSSINSTVIAEGANVLLSTSGLVIGNSTVNTTANSSRINTGTVSLSTNVLVGANVSLSTLALGIGNTTANLFINSVLIELANSTVITNVSPGGMTVAQSIVNSSGFYGGATDVLSLGNSTVNLVVNSSQIFFNGAAFHTAANTIVAINGTTVGNAAAINFNPQSGVSMIGSVDAGDGFVNVNVSFSGSLAGAGGANTNILFNDSGSIGGSAGLLFNKQTNNATVANTLLVGANVFLNTSALSIGNTTVNLFANSLLLELASATGSANVTPSGLVVGTSTVNSTALASGANVIANTSSVVVGNSTVFFFANSLLAQVANSTATANLAVSGLTVGTSIVNTTAFAAGANVILGVASLNVGNSTVNTVVNSTFVSTGTANITASVNVGANVFLSTIALNIGNSTVNLFANSLLLQVSNSTAVSNVLPGVVALGAATLNTTALALGANVFLNQTLLKIGNSTVNGVANSVELLFQNSTISSNVTLTGFWTGNTSANVQVNSSSVTVLGVMVPVYNEVRNLYGAL